MACRQTTAIIDPAVRMLSTICELFFRATKQSLTPVSVLSSSSVQAVSIAHSAVQHCRGSFNTMLLTRQPLEHSPRDDTRMDSRLRGNDGGGGKDSGTSWETVSWWLTLRSISKYTLRIGRTCSEETPSSPVWFCRLAGTDHDLGSQHLSGTCPSGSRHGCHG